MKRFFIVALALAMTSLSAHAQMQLPALPLDEAIRTGKLDNGMTYYIRYNALPENRAEFYLATHVGAVQEAPDQDGLAHFLEHMCFNGTKNFPDKGILNWLESIGASFGGNVNAATGFEGTQYMLNNIPLVRPTVVDTCLLIMHDYSHFVTCDPTEIDNERGVIIEEKRSRNNAGWRTYQAASKYYFKDSRMADCSLIGSEEQLRTFAYSSLTNFYHTWYRPDLQALIVVGDIDVDEVEAKIKDIFADIPAAENPQAKGSTAIPDNEEPIIGIITDPENVQTSIELIWKSETSPAEVNGSIMGLMSDILEDLYSSAMNERLNDIAAKVDAPFLSAGFGIGQLNDATDAVFAEMVCREGESLEGLQALYTEIEKMKRYGFTAAEYDRAKAELLTSYENAANRAETRKNPEFIQPMIQHFFRGNYILAPEARLEMVKQLLPRLDAASLNQGLAQIITDNNLVAVYTGIAKEGISHPDESQILDVINTIKASEIEAPIEEVTAKELLKAKKIKGSKIAATEQGIYNSTVWTLKNGVKVVLLPTDYEKNSISIDLVMNGGESLIDTEDLHSASGSVFNLYLQNTGVAQFSNTELTKILAGKTVFVNPYISTLRHGISASTTPKDVETTLQLMYLYFTSPRFDQDEFNLGINQMKAMLPSMEETSDYKLSANLSRDLYGNNPRRQPLSMEIVEGASLTSLRKVYEKLFSDAAGATVYVVGDFTLDGIKPLICKYIGALPKGKEAGAWIDRNVDMVKTDLVDDFKARMETPMVTVYEVFRFDTPYSPKVSTTFDALSYVMDMVYTQTLREEEGGTYGASTGVDISIEPKQYGYFIVAFQTNPESADKLIALSKEGLKKIAGEGPTAEQFEKTYNNFKKNIPESRIRNSYWESILKSYDRYGIDMNVLKEEAALNLSAEDIQNAARTIVENANLIEIIMRPE